MVLLTYIRGLYPGPLDASKWPVGPIAYLLSAVVYTIVLSVIYWGNYFTKYIEVVFIINTVDSRYNDIG